MKTIAEYLILSSLLQILKKNYLPFVEWLVVSTAEIVYCLDNTIADSFGLMLLLFTLTFKFTLTFILRLTGLIG